MYLIRAFINNVDFSTFQCFLKISSYISFHRRVHIRLSFHRPPISFSKKLSKCHALLIHQWIQSSSWAVNWSFKIIFQVQLVSKSVSVNARLAFNQFHDLLSLDFLGLVLFPLLSPPTQTNNVTDEFNYSNAFPSMICPANNFFSMDGRIFNIHDAKIRPILAKILNQMTQMKQLRWLIAQ